MKRRLIKFLAIGVAVTMLCGCHMGGEQVEVTQTADSKSASQQHIGLIYPSLSGEFTSKHAKEMQDKLGGIGYRVDVVSSDNDPAKELQQLENYVNMGVDKIVLFPIGASAKEIGGTLKKIKDKGIEVIVWGNAVTLGTFDAMIIVSNEELGHSTAKMAAEWIDMTFPDAPDKSIEVALTTTTTSVESKTQSEALRVIEDLTPKAKIVAEYMSPAGDSISKVQDNIDIMFTEHPDVKVILTYSNDQALAVNEKVMSRAGIDKAHFGVFGSNITQVTLQAIKASVSGESVLRGTNIFGDGTAKSLIDAVLGNLELNEDNIYYPEIQDITTDNVEGFIK